MYQAACYGNVGASFAVEQIGLPELRENEDGKVWNNVNPYLRLKEYMSRLEADYWVHYRAYKDIPYWKTIENHGLAKGKHIENHIIVDKLSYTHKSNSVLSEKPQLNLSYCSCHLECYDFYHNPCRTFDPTKTSCPVALLSGAMTVIASCWDHSTNVAIRKYAYNNSARRKHKNCREGLSLAKPLYHKASFFCNARTQFDGWTVHCLTS